MVCGRLSCDCPSTVNGKLKRLSPLPISMQNQSQWWGWWWWRCSGRHSLPLSPTPWNLLFPPGKVFGDKSATNELYNQTKLQTHFACPHLLGSLLPPSTFSETVRQWTSLTKPNSKDVLSAPISWDLPPPPPPPPPVPLWRRLGNERVWLNETPNTFWLPVWASW